MVPRECLPRTEVSITPDLFLHPFPSSEYSSWLLRSLYIIGISCLAYVMFQHQFQSSSLVTVATLGSHKPGGICCLLFVHHLPLPSSSSDAAPTACNKHRAPYSSPPHPLPPTLHSLPSTPTPFTTHANPTQASSSDAAPKLVWNPALNPGLHQTQGSVLIPSTLQHPHHQCQHPLLASNTGLGTWFLLP